MKKKSPIWLIIVGAGRFQKIGIITAESIGISVLAIDGNPNAEGFIFASKHIVADIRNPKLVLKEVQKSKITPAGAITIASEIGMTAVGLLRDFFKLPCAGLSLTNALTSKGAQRKIWEKKELPNPKWTIVNSKKKLALEQIEYIGLPLIVKPTDSAGSRGVAIISNLEDCANAIKIAANYSNIEEVLLESILPGDEYTVETFTINNKTYILAITQKKKIDSTNGTVAYELHTPDLIISDRIKIEETVIKALDALGYSDGPGHSEVMYHKDYGVGLIEVAGRGPGFYMFEKFIPMASGYDVVKNSILQSIGMIPDNPEKIKKHVVMRYIPSRAGVVESFSGFDKANRINGVNAGVFVEIGDHISDAYSDGDRMGYILTNSDSNQHARLLADRAESLINFEIV